MLPMCPEYHRLSANVESILAKLAELTSTHLQMFRERDYSGAMRIDKELEHTIGEKERALGALRQHLREHRCQRPYLL